MVLNFVTEVMNEERYFSSYSTIDLEVDNNLKIKATKQEVNALVKETKEPTIKFKFYLDGESVFGIFYIKRHKRFHPQQYSSNHQNTIETHKKKLLIMQLSVLLDVNKGTYWCNCLVLGCDPELDPLNFQCRVQPPAKDYRMFTEIGRDCGHSIELRPQCSCTPEGLTESIRKLFQYLEPVGVYGNIDTLGGHLHISFGDISEYETKVKKYSQGIVLLLDIVLGIPSQYKEHPNRTLSHYGAVGSYYEKLYDDMSVGIEYRTLSAAWMESPEIARIVFKIAKNAIKNIYTEGVVDLKINKDFSLKKSEYVKWGLLTEQETEMFFNWLKEPLPKYPINNNWVPDSCDLSKFELGVIDFDLSPNDIKKYKSAKQGKTIVMSEEEIQNLKTQNRQLKEIYRTIGWIGDSRKYKIKVKNNCKKTKVLIKRNDRTNEVGVFIYLTYEQNSLANALDILEKKLIKLNSQTQAA